MTSPTTCIRRATAEDAAALRELYVAYFDEHRQWYAFSPPRERYAHIFGGYWADRTQHYFVATVDGAIAGFMRCALKSNASPTGYVLRGAHGGRRERINDAKRTARATLQAAARGISGGRGRSTERVAGVVNDFFVAHDFRGQGLASRLLDAGFVWWRTHSAEFVALEVMAQNENAIGFYERYGFHTERRVMMMPLNDAPESVTSRDTPLRDT